MSKTHVIPYLYRSFSHPSFGGYISGVKFSHDESFLQVATKSSVFSFSTAESVVAHLSLLTHISHTHTHRNTHFKHIAPTDIVSHCRLVSCLYNEKGEYRSHGGDAILSSVCDFLCEFKSHRADSQIRCFDVVPTDENFCISADDNGNMFVWEMLSGGVVAHIKFRVGIVTFAFNPTNPLKCVVSLESGELREVNLIDAIIRYNNFKAQDLLTEPQTQVSQSPAAQSAPAERVGSDAEKDDESEMGEDETMENQHVTDDQEMVGDYAASRIRVCLTDEWIPSYLSVHSITRCMKFNLSGSILITTDGSVIHFWETETKTLIRSIANLAAEDISALALSMQMAPLKDLSRGLEVDVFSLNETNIHLPDFDHLDKTSMNAQAPHLNDIKRISWLNHRNMKEQAKLFNDQNTRVSIPVEIYTTPQTKPIMRGSAKTLSNQVSVHKCMKAGFEDVNNAMDILSAMAAETNRLRALEASTHTGFELIADIAQQVCTKADIVTEQYNEKDAIVNAAIAAVALGAEIDFAPLQAQEITHALRSQPSTCDLPPAHWTSRKRPKVQ